MTEEKIMKMMARIKRSSDGPEFIEYLETLSKDNYKSWVSDAPDRDQEHKGYAKCIDSLIQTFKDCTIEKQKVDPQSVHGDHAY